MIEDIIGRLNNLEEIISNIIRPGIVTQIDEKKCRCKVQFKDNNGIVSYWCQVLVPLAHKSKYYALPAINEEVLCLFLGYGSDCGFILGSMYSKSDAIPAGADKDKIITEDYSGNRDEFDAKSHTHTAKSLKHQYYGDVEIFGNLKVNGTINDAMGNLTIHTNGGYPRDV